MRLGEIEQLLQQAGLSPRAAFHPGADDCVPPLARFHMQAFLESHRSRRTL